MFQVRVVRLIEVRLPYNQLTTFDDLRHELEEDIMTSYQSLIINSPSPPTLQLALVGHKSQSGVCEIMTSRHKDCTYKMPYFVYITKDKGTKEESKVGMKKKRRGYFQERLIIRYLYYLFETKPSSLLKLIH